MVRGCINKLNNTNTTTLNISYHYVVRFSLKCFVNVVSRFTKAVIGLTLSTTIQFTEWCYC